MLIDFTCENFRSFAGSATLDLATSRLKTTLPRDGADWSHVLSPVAAIFGPNAAGKSTIIDAIWSISRAIRRPGNRSIYQPYAGNDGVNRACKYSIAYTGGDGIRYEYDLEVQRWGIAFESLYSFPRGTRRLLFTREQVDKNSTIEFKKGPSLKGPSQEVLRLTRTHMLYLANALKYGHPGLTAAASALASESGVQHVSFRDKQDQQVLERVAMEMIASPSEQEDIAESLLHAADLGIENLDMKEEEIPQEVRDQMRRLVEALKSGDEEESEDLEAIVPQVRDVVVFHHTDNKGGKFELPVSAESSGTITWLTTAWHALNALRAGTVLIIDELDASLHPDLVRYLVSLFLNPSINVAGAQLIFTTHDINLMGNVPTRLLEPHMVWLVEKGEGGVSDLFSLDEFNNRPGNNSQKRYLSGAFGAVPEINEALLVSYLRAEDRGE
ncbi:AAA family ATPase [Micrococcus luteus]|uniref:AAA family ATPase n=1 Tax=Micrococcus luteus TaxID=1270 RepID=UPI003EC00AB9